MLCSARTHSYVFTPVAYSGVLLFHRAHFDRRNFSARVCDLDEVFCFRSKYLAISVALMMLVRASLTGR